MAVCVGFGEGVPRVGWILFLRRRRLNSIAAVFCRTGASGADDLRAMIFSFGQCFRGRKED